MIVLRNGGLQVEPSRIDDVLDVPALREGAALVAIDREVLRLPCRKAPHIETCLEILVGPVGRLTVVLRTIEVLLSLGEQVGAGSGLSALQDGFLESRVC